MTTQTKGRACDGKVRYTKAAARKAAAFARKRLLATRVTAYKCRYCGSFHIGHTPRRRRANS